MLDKVSTCERIIQQFMMTERRCIKILDLGCGGGFPLESLKNLASFSHGVEFYGIDLSPESQRECLQKGYHEVKLFDLELGIPHGDNTFGIVYASEVIEHIFDTEKFLREIYRVLSPKGLLIIATPNLSYIANLYFIIRRSQLTNVNWGRGACAHRHVSYFSPKTLARQLEAVGFREIHFHSHKPPLWMRRRLLSLILQLPFISSQMNQCMVVSARK